ncbi:MAG TPA: hypothetical protein VFT74_00580 [Isosphaeraceae bacterium]|nr:hypothetical protein [Isosphaeraceae bacterium]
MSKLPIDPEDALRPPDAFAYDPDWDLVRPAWRQFHILDLVLLILVVALSLAVCRTVRVHARSLPPLFLPASIGFLYGPFHIGLQFRRGRREPLRLGEFVWILQFLVVFGVIPLGYAVLRSLWSLVEWSRFWETLLLLPLTIVTFLVGASLVVLEVALPLLSVLGLITFLLPKVDDSRVLWTEPAGYLFSLAPWVFFPVLLPLH